MCTCFCETFCCFLLRWRDSLHHDNPNPSQRPNNRSSTSLTSFSPGHQHPHPHPRPNNSPQQHQQQDYSSSPSNFQSSIPPFLTRSPAPPQQIYLPPQPMTHPHAPMPNPSSQTQENPQDLQVQDSGSKGRRIGPPLLVQTTFEGAPSPYVGALESEGAYLASHQGDGGRLKNSFAR